MLDQASKQAEKMEMKNARGEGKKAAAEMMEWETRRSSRLFAVDAGLDRATLRSRFPDRAKYAIVHGQVRPMWSTQGKDAAGAIDTLTAEAVNVPFEMRDAFEGVAESSYTPSDKDDGHFEAVLAFGRRLEPWLMSVAKKQIGPPEASTR